MIIVYNHWLVSLEYVCELKYDGVAISLIMKWLFLVGVTGDGVREMMLQQILNNKTIP